MNPERKGVLAVMLRDANHANRYRHFAENEDRSLSFSLTEVSRSAGESDKALTAVAELVEAASNYEQHPYDAKGVNIAARNRLRDALLPFQSEAES